MNFSSKASAPYINIRLISFVSSSQELPIKTKEKSSWSGLNGKEASDFYNDVISSAPSSRCLNTSSKVSENSTTRTSPKNETNLRSKSASSSTFVPKSAILRYAQEGDLKNLQRCIAAGCSVDTQDAYGWTPLMCATYEGHYECVKYLIQCKADIDIKCTHGMSASDLARKTHHRNVLDLLQKQTFTSSVSNNLVDSAKNANNFEQFCETCNISFKSSKQEHLKSIAHLVSKKDAVKTTFYHISENNKGYQLMLKSGWDKEKGLGINADGRKFPIKTVLKKDRSCIGQKKEAAKVTHFSAFDTSSIKSNKCDFVKMKKERTVNKQKRKKIELINRQKEIQFRRQFN